MALFKGKKSESAGKAAPKKKLRKGDRMSTVFKETVMESVLEDLRENGAFDVSGPADFSSGTGHETYHVAWLLEAASVGGISKNAAKQNDDLGAFIECVNNNRVKVILNRSMIAMDVIAFIMDRETVEAMDEFSFMRNAPFQTMYISDDASVMSTDGSVEVSFDDARDVVDGKVTIQELLRKRGCEWLGGSAEEAADIADYDDDADGVGEPEVEDGVFDEVDSPYISGDKDIEYGTPGGDGGEYAGDVDEYSSDVAVEGADANPVSADASMADIDALLAGNAPAPGASATPDFGGDPFAMGGAGGGYNDIAMNEQALFQEDIQRQAQQSTMGREEPYAGQQQAGMQPAAPAAAGITPDVAEMTRVIRSAYYTHDLGLEITTAPFDEQFGEGNPVAYFDEDRGDGFMNEYLSQISREANADMRHLRDSNLHHLRERYIYMMSLYAKRVTEELDVSDPESRYGRNKAQIRAEHDKSVAEIDSRVESLRSSLQSDFDRGMAEAAELAAAQAKERYRHKHESALKQRVMDAEARVRADIEATYQADINKMYEARRIEAARRMDAGEAEILGLLSREYSTMYVDEYRLYRQYREEISRWVDNNRKEDIAYAETLREEQRQAEKADAVRSEYEVKLQQQAAEFEHRRQGLEADIERNKLRHEELLADVEARHGEEVVSLRNKNEELQRQFDDLLDRYSSLDATKAQEYDLRLKQAKDEADVERKRAEQASQQNKGTYRMVIVLMVVAVIAALCIGIVIGMRQNIDYVSNLAQIGSAADVAAFLPLLM